MKKLVHHLVVFAMAFAFAATLAAQDAADPNRPRPGGDFDGPPPGEAGGPPGRGGFGGMMQPETKLVTQFDKDGDKRLNVAERKAAREFLQKERAGGRGRRGPGGRGFPGRNDNQAPPQPGAKVSPADVKSFANVPLYDSNTVRTVFLEFEGADWEKELADFKNTDVEVPAKVTVDGKTSVFLKSASSFSQSAPSNSRNTVRTVFES